MAFDTRELWGLGVRGVGISVAEEEVGGSPGTPVDIKPIPFSTIYWTPAAGEEELLDELYGPELNGIFRGIMGHPPRPVDAILEEGRPEE